MRNFSAPHNDNSSYQLADYFPEYQKGILYLLWEKLKQGNVCIDWEEVSKDNPDWYPDFEPVSKKEYSEKASGDPLIISSGNLLYIHRYYKYETSLIEKIKSLVSAPPNEIGKGNHIDAKDPDQKKAILSSLQKNFIIISGGPGTGKTTTVTKILAQLFSAKPDLKVALAAPTGKAAARMAESLKNAGRDMDNRIKEHLEKLMPSTIHRLLGFKPNSIYFRFNEENHLPFDLIIIDESSMIDLALFSKLLRAIDPKTKLILLGDQHQLASVEAGSVFSDLCSLSEELKTVAKEKSYLEKDSGENVIVLKHSYRFSSDKGIGKFSNIILKKDFPELDKFLKETDGQVQVDSDYEEKLFETFILGFAEYIKENDLTKAFEKLNRLRVLCAVREGLHGVYQINARIEKILERKNLIRRTGVFYHNRPVMITKNNYSLQLFNGDTGIVREGKDGKLKVWFESKGELVSYPVSFITGEETAYAITIHKSQGSEYNQVLTILPEKDNQILTKELIYTAVTRAREKVIIQCRQEILKSTIDRDVRRGSGIKQRFLNQ